MNRLLLTMGGMAVLAMAAGAFAGWSSDGQSDGLGTQAMDLDMGDHSVINIETNGMMFVGGAAIGTDGSNLTFKEANETDYVAMATAQLVENEAAIRATAVDLLRGKDQRQDGYLTAEVWARMMGDAANALESPGAIWDAFSSSNTADTTTEAFYDADGDYWYSQGATVSTVTGDVAFAYDLNDDAASSTVLDGGADAANGTLYHNEVEVNTSTRSAVGKVGDCLRFDYVSDSESTEVRIPGDAVETYMQSSFTITFWVDMDDGINSWNWYCFGSKKGAADAYISAYTWNSAGQFTVIIHDGTTGKRIGSNGTVFPNGDTGWMFLAVVFDFDTDTCILYKNGSEITLSPSYSGDLTGVDTSAFDLDYFILSGHWYDGLGAAWRGMDGYLDEFTIHNKALSAAEIEEIYDANVAGDSIMDIPDGGSGGNMTIVFDPVAWDTTLNAVTAYVALTNTTADTNFTVDVSLDGQTNWTSITCDTVQGDDGTTYRYSGTGTVSPATLHTIDYRIQTTNEPAMRFNAIGIMGDAQ